MHILVYIRYYDIFISYAKNIVKEKTMHNKLIAS